MLYTCFYKSPLGGITMASDGNALTGLWFDGQKYFAEDILPKGWQKLPQPKLCRFLMKPCAGWIFILAAAGRILRRR